MKNSPFQLTSLHWIVAWLAIPLIGHSQSDETPSFAHVYKGSELSTSTLPPWQLGRKGGGGREVVLENRLRVEVPPEAVHTYTMDGQLTEANEPVFDASGTAGTTVDFGLRVESGSAEQDVFSIRIGTGENSWQVIFSPSQVRVGNQFYPHNVSERDVYRLIVENGKLSVFSARAGILLENITGEKRYVENRLSMGTRQSLSISEPVVWELDFIQWTNTGAYPFPPKLP